MIAGAASMGIRPREFWELTPYELALYARGQTDKRHSDMEALAWLQSNLMNVQIAKGKRLSARDLYRRPDAEVEFSDEESFRRYMKARASEE